MSNPQDTGGLPNAIDPKYTPANTTVVDTTVSWTAATLNTSYQALAAGNPVGFWLDPFGIVHVRGVVQPIANISLTNATSVGIANGFPKPKQTSLFLGASANDTAIASNTQSFVQWSLFANGSFQITGKYPLATANLVYASLDGICYDGTGQ